MTEEAFNQIAIATGRGMTLDEAAQYLIEKMHGAAADGWKAIPETHRVIECHPRGWLMTMVLVRLV